MWQMGNPWSVESKIAKCVQCLGMPRGVCAVHEQEVYELSVRYPEHAQRAMLAAAVNAGRKGREMRRWMKYAAGGDEQLEGGETVAAPDRA